MPRMPQVSTPPQPLPPLKRPTPYEGTEYADITEFRKGDASPKTDSTDPEIQAQGAINTGLEKTTTKLQFRLWLSVCFTIDSYRPSSKLAAISVPC